MDVSCGFPPRRDTPELIALAEALGFARAWVYDSPALYHDTWMTLARAADRTTRIGLGPAVLVPSLRHVMVNAAATATLEDLAPGRVSVAVGAGFTGRMTMGRSGLGWSQVRAYVAELRALLAGETVEVDGRPCRMLHPDGWAPPRPVEVPILLGADGPKGHAVARELGDGILTALPNGAGFDRAGILTFGTVLDDGEAPDDPRALAAAGPAVTVAAHFGYVHGGMYAALLDALPGGPQWRASIDAVDPAQRHLLLHEQHLTGVNDRDRPLLTGETVSTLTWTGSAADLRARAEATAAAGITEIVWQPCGLDLERELRTWAAALI